MPRYWLAPITALVALSGCHRGHETAKAAPGSFPSSPKLSSSVATAIANNPPPSGAADESGAPYSYGPCIISLVDSHLTCDFGLVVYDSGAKDKFHLKAPPALAFTPDQNLMIADGLAPAQLFIKDGDTYRAVDPRGRIREVKPAANGTYMAYMDAQSNDVYKLFDANKRLIKEVDPTTHTLTEYTYNDKGQLTEQRTPNQTITLTYNGGAMPASITVGKTMLSVEDTAKTLKITSGQQVYLNIVKSQDPMPLADAIDFNNAHYELTYVAGALASLTDGKGSGVTIARSGDRVSVKQLTTGNVIYTAQFKGRYRMQSASPNGGETVSRDEYGRIVKVESLDGRQTVYRYNDDGHVVAVGAIVGNGETKLVSSTTYNQFGEPTKATEGETEKTYSYDNTGRLVSVNETAPGMNHKITVNSYDDAGRILAMHEETVHTEKHAVKVAYDSAGKVTSRDEENDHAKATSTIDATTGSVTTLATADTGSQSVYKKTYNPLDQSTTEDDKTVDPVGRVHEVTTISGPNGSQKIEANESGVLVTQTFDPKGKLVKYESRYTTDPQFAWAAASVIQTPKPATAQAQSAPRAKTKTGH